MRLRIGTRKSAMALARTEDIARRLVAMAPDVDVENVKFETMGDIDQTGKLLPHGGKGGPSSPKSAMPSAPDSCRQLCIR